MAKVGVEAGSQLAACTRPSLARSRSLGAFPAKSQQHLLQGPPTSSSGFRIIPQLWALGHSALGPRSDFQELMFPLTPLACTPRVLTWTRVSSPPSLGTQGLSDALEARACVR